MPTETRTWETREHEVRREIDAWEAGFANENWWGPSHPDPRTLRGLPDRWRLMGHLSGYEPDTDLFLAHRGHGWVILRHDFGLRRTSLFWMEATVVEMYANVVAQYEGAPRHPALVGLPRVITWLKDLLIGWYDETDPVEAGERLVLALGGAVHVVPRAVE